MSFGKTGALALRKVREDGPASPARQGVRSPNQNDRARIQADVSSFS